MTWDELLGSVEEPVKRLLERIENGRSSSRINYSEPNQQKARRQAQLDARNEICVKVEAYIDQPLSPAKIFALKFGQIDVDNLVFETTLWAVAQGLKNANRS